MLVERLYEHARGSVCLREVRYHLPRDTIHVLLRIAQTHARPEPGDRLHVAAYAVLILRLAKGLRSPKVRVIRIVEILREDANHGDYSATDFHRPADDRRISSQQTLPQSVTQDD